MHTLDKIYAIIPYCYPVKGKTQRFTRLFRVRRTSSEEYSIITWEIPHRGHGVNNIRVGIVHDDRFFGYIHGVRPGPEKTEAISRRILNPESRNPVGTQFL